MITGDDLTSERHTRPACRPFDGNVVSLNRGACEYSLVLNAYESGRGIRDTV
jgi:hypothetical protein